MKMIEFHHGALSASYEEQANAQGYTFGDDAKLVEDMWSCILRLRFYDCFTDSEYDKILLRFQKNVLMEKIKVMEANEDEASERVVTWVSEARPGEEQEAKFNNWEGAMAYYRQLIDSPLFSDVHIKKEKKDPDCEYYRERSGGVCFAQKCAPRCECGGIKERCDIYESA